MPCRGTTTSQRTHWNVSISTPAKRIALTSTLPGLVNATDVAALRRWTLTLLRRGDETALTEPHDLGPVVQQMASGKTPAQVRVALAWLVVNTRDLLGISVQDTEIWIDSAGLRGLHRSVRDLAAEAGLSARQVHRRIEAVNTKVAALLTRDEQRWHAAASTNDPFSSTSSREELIERLRSEAFATPNPERALDAITKYARHATSPNVRPQYLLEAKDRRYRDAPSVHGWSKTLANQPPVSSLTPSDNARLINCTGIHLAVDPQGALANIGRAIATQQRDILPVLLAHAGHLIPDAAAAGTDAWLSYLQLRYHAAMESEHISALRWATAWQSESVRLIGIGDTRVRRAMAGRAHTLQMFGHYKAADHCYRAVVQHAAHFGASGVLDPEALHDAYGQIAYTQALSGKNANTAKTALRRMNTLADDLGDVGEIQFTRARRLLEVELAAAINPASMSMHSQSRRNQLHLEDAMNRLLTEATTLPKANRQLVTCDLLLLYAIATRDAGLATEATTAFQRTNDVVGGFANLTDRFNARRAVASAVSTKLRDLEPVRGPEDPLREKIGLPRKHPGLLMVKKP